jgi:anthranilate synthase/aminodeoxychorismate synthase-like glutamine amidotransferase
VAGPRVLVIDNYDSFVYNLVQYLGELDAEPIVHRHDQVTLEELEALAPDAVLVSPGPGRPEDAGVSNDAIRTFGDRGVPVLGVCLGAQLLAHALGGSVSRLPKRFIAWTAIEPLPAAVGDPVLGSLPAGSFALHWNEDGIEPPPGAVELLRRPAGTAEGFRYGARAWGVQFHPEVDPENLEGWYRTGYMELPEAGVTEERARAADAVHLPGQRAVSEALFGGFARVVAARTVAA